MAEVIRCVPTKIGSIIHSRALIKLKNHSLELLVTEIRLTFAAQKIKPTNAIHARNLTIKQMRFFSFLNLKKHFHDYGY